MASIQTQIDQFKEFAANVGLWNRNAVKVNKEALLGLIMWSDVSIQEKLNLLKQLKEIR